jgi:hypothetical protein
VRHLLIVALAAMMPALPMAAQDFNKGWKA